VWTAGRGVVGAVVGGGRLRLVVRDDGPGMGKGTARAGSGTGLRNTRERLVQLYGDDASLRIEGPPEGGTLVTVEIRVVGRPVPGAPAREAAHV
jgi:sensor histidine kinase YesM